MNVDIVYPQFIMHKHSVAIIISDAWLLLLFDSLWDGTRLAGYFACVFLLCIPVKVNNWSEMSHCTVDFDYLYFYFLQNTNFFFTLKCKKEWESKRKSAKRHLKDFNQFKKKSKLDVKPFNIKKTQRGSVFFFFFLFNKSAKITNICGVNIISARVILNPLELCKYIVSVLFIVIKL